jgi:hypothetical protein
MSSQELAEHLKQLEAKRKAKEISAKEFYTSLLSLLQELVQNLEGENIDEIEIRKQIPLLLTFIKAQIKNLASRGS